MKGPYIGTDIAATDHLCDRWGRIMRSERGLMLSMTPLAVAMTKASGEPLGGCDDIAEDILRLDRVIGHAPAADRALLVEWYVRNTPAIAIARRTGMTRSALYVVWRGTLRYLQGALAAIVLDEQNVRTLKRSRVPSRLRDEGHGA